MEYFDRLLLPEATGFSTIIIAIIIFFINKFNSFMDDLKALKDLIGRLDNRKALMRQISEIMYSEVIDNFNNEGNPKWEPLKKSTIRQRKKRGYWPGKILQRSGGREGLIASIQTDYSNDFSSVFTNKKYAAIHNYGGTINIKGRSEIFLRNRYKRGKKKGKFKKGTSPGKGYTIKNYVIRIPQREFMKISGKGEENIKEAIIKFVKGNN